MSKQVSETAFSPLEVSDEGLAELRRLAEYGRKDAPEFCDWLATWCNTEASRRLRDVKLCTPRHAMGLPDANQAKWSPAAVGKGLLASYALVVSTNDWTAEMFAERLLLSFVSAAADVLQKVRLDD